MQAVTKKRPHMEPFRENHMWSLSLGYSYSLIFQKGEQAWRVLRESLSELQLPQNLLPTTDLPEELLVITNDRG